jgi:hypothetical protein
MLSWHVPYLRWTRLPADVSEFEITHFFSLRAEERSAVSWSEAISSLLRSNSVTLAGNR